MGKMIAIDTEALRQAICDKGLTLAEASKQLGFSRKYFVEVLNRGNISPSGVVGLNYILGIKFEEYEAKQSEEEVEAEATAMPMYSNDYIRERIRSVCKTQGILAQKIGRSDSYISGWLNGDGTFRLTDIAGVAVVLGIDRDRIPANFKESEQAEVIEEVAQDSCGCGYDDAEILNKLDKIIEGIDKLLTVFAGVADTHEREVKYLSHIMRNTRHFETFEETMQKTKADSMTMTVGGGDK